MHACMHAGWRRCMRCLNVQISFCKRATDDRLLLQTMTFKDKDKASDGSWPPCSIVQGNASRHANDRVTLQAAGQLNQYVRIRELWLCQETYLKWVTSHVQEQLNEKHQEQIVGNDSCHPWSRHGTGGVAVECNVAVEFSASGRYAKGMRSVTEWKHQQQMEGNESCHSCERVMEQAA